VNDPNRTDEELLHAVAQRDVHALELLYDRHANTIYNLVFRIVKDGTVAEGIMQETFLQVWQKAHEYAGTGVGAAWMFRIARNKSLDQLRRNKARPVSAEKAIEEHYGLTDAPSDGVDLTPVEASVERSYSRSYIRAALAQIPPDQRLCLELAYFEGMSQSQIAEYTNTPLGTIKTRVRMGMQKLEHILRTYGFRGSEDVE
jgi:RNA polymerase sigma-70 factor (ECF subfamily)